eukprot:scaffold259638_cov37-Tisochrysis_lutea.AAC.1
MQKKPASSQPQQKYIRRQCTRSGAFWSARAGHSLKPAQTRIPNTQRPACVRGPLRVRAPHRGLGRSLSVRPCARQASTWAALMQRPHYYVHYAVRVCLLQDMR